MTFLMACSGQLCLVSLYRKQGGIGLIRGAYGKDGFLLRRCDLMRDMGFCISMKRSLLEVLGCLGRDIVGRCSLGASLLLKRNLAGRLYRSHKYVDLLKN